MYLIYQTQTPDPSLRVSIHDYGWVSNFLTSALIHKLLHIEILKCGKTGRVPWAVRRRITTSSSKKGQIGGQRVGIRAIARRIPISQLYLELPGKSVSWTCSKSPLGLCKSPSTPGLRSFSFFVLSSPAEKWPAIGSFCDGDLHCGSSQLASGW